VERAANMSIFSPPKHQKLIPFNIPTITGSEISHINTAIQNRDLASNGRYNRLCQSWLEQHLSCKKVLLTPSCTSALDLAALVLDIKPGDEVILPSYRHPSTANAFLLRGASLVFLDIVPETMNLNPTQLREAITDRTRGLVPVHYAGFGCDMDEILQIARERGIYVVEDAAMGVFSTYKGRALGTMGQLGCISFQEGENITAGGQGGALLVNDPDLIERAGILWNRGMSSDVAFRSTDEGVDTWQLVGGSYQLSELQAAYLWGQLEGAETIQIQRHRIWNVYYKELEELETQGLIQLPALPPHREHNACMFWIKVRDMTERRDFMESMKGVGISVLPHYSPLHKTGPGVNHRHVMDEDVVTRESERLVRLPIYFALTMDDARFVIDQIKQFYSSGKVFSSGI
jgi:dTDP-4-amino-4,6-dideoxygalactose transaminase